MMRQLTLEITRTTLILSLVMISCSSIINGQHLVRGKILDKTDREPLIGASILEKNTTRGTTADLDGDFQLTVQSPNAILVIQHVGYTPEEIEIKGRTDLNILLGGNCMKCWFDYQEINVSLYSGLLKTPLGVGLDISSPVLFKEPVLRLSGKLQTDFNRNDYLNLGVSLNHLLSSCQFDADISFQFNRFRIEDWPNLNDYSAFINLNWNKKINPIVGIKRFSFPGNDSPAVDNGVLYGIGFRSYTRLPIFLAASNVIYFNNSQVNYTAQIRSYYKSISLFLNFYKFEAISELSIGLGYEFRYLFQRQKEEYQKVKDGG